MKGRSELLVPGRGLVDQLDGKERAFNETRTLGVKMPGEKLDESAKSDNGSLLEKGDHGHLVLDKPNTHLMGVPGALAQSSRVEADARISGMQFEGEVRIDRPSSCTGIFMDCVFDAPVIVGLGYKAHFIGCLFRGTASVVNAGAAVNVSIVGCSRKSGVAHVNVTILSETL